VRDLRGKLEDDLTRIRDIVELATGDSLVVMNEAFTSTTLADALTLGRHIMRRLIDLDLLAVYVTFVDELAAAGPHVVSMVATVDPVDPTIRTYRVVRRPADGLAYAVAIARKHGLTRQALKERLTI
jgi:DNA mismatch repair ATPase MutS